jgi:ABC-type transporter Mla MlaB component
MKINLVISLGLILLFSCNNKKNPPVENSRLVICFSENGYYINKKRFEEKSFLIFKDEVKKYFEKKIDENTILVLSDLSKVDFSFYELCIDYIDEVKHNEGKSIRITEIPKLEYLLLKDGDLEDTCF